MTYKIAILMTRSICVNGREKRSAERNSERSCRDYRSGKSAEKGQRRRYGKTLLVAVASLKGPR